MRLIVYHVGNRRLLFAPLIAIITFLLTHICCFGPILLVPLGLGGIIHILNDYILIRVSISLIMILLLIFNGFKIFIKNKNANFIEKVTYILSLIIVLYMISTNWLIKVNN